MEVHYRTTGSFLVSYSLNLSMGGLFLETERLVPAGTHLVVRFTIPGAAEPVETNARVVWVRPANREGLPPGLGLQFEALEERIGALIDSLVRDFAGLTMLAVAAESHSSERLARYLRSILSCEVEQTTPQQVAQRGLRRTADLVLVDLDSTGPVGLDVLHEAVSRQPPVPVVVATASAQLAGEATRAGAASVVENPPRFEVLRRCVLDVISRPTRYEAG